MSVPLCTAGEEKLAGEPGGRKGWSKRQAERAAEMPPAEQTTRKEEEFKRQSTERMANERISVRSRWKEGNKKI